MVTVIAYATTCMSDNVITVAVSRTGCSGGAKPAPAEIGRASERISPMVATIQYVRAGRDENRTTRANTRLPNNRYTSVLKMIWTGPAVGHWPTLGISAATIA